MSITISGKHLEVGDALRQHIENGINSISHRYFGDPIEAHVVMAKETHQYSVDLSVLITRHFVVRTHAADIDPYRCFDLAADRMEHRIQRYKSRLRDKRRRPYDEQVLAAQQYVLNVEEEDQGEDAPLIIAEMVSGIPTLTVGEAVMRLDLSDQPVMMFKNSKHGELNVVYKRNDGHIGWIDPSIKSDS